MVRVHQGVDADHLTGFEVNADTAMGTRWTLATRFSAVTITWPLLVSRCIGRGGCGRRADGGAAKAVPAASSAR